MGTYLNPGNSGFEEIRNSQYVDKSGMIALINSTIGTEQKLTCISRPRRFGKSFAAQMLRAYYDKTCMIIDEWDAPIREAPEVHKEYLEFLRTLLRHIFQMKRYDWNLPERSVR